MGVPSAVALLAMVMHLPTTSSLPSERTVHSCAPVWLQPHSWMALPLSLIPERSSTHIPLMPVIGPVPGLRTCQTNDADPEVPPLAVAVTVTLLLPAVVGTPAIRPVAELMDSPAGKPAAL